MKVITVGMDTTHSIHSGLKYDGLSSEAERDVRMHYTEIIAYLTGLSKHPGLDVVFDFQMSVYPTNQRPPAWATDEISKISVVHEEQDTVHQPQAPGAEVLANIERAHKEDMEAVEARWKREMEGLRDQLRAVEADCDKKCGEHDRRGYAMGYAFADEKATKAFQAMRADLQRLTAENKELREQIEEDKQMVQRHLKEIAKEHAQMTAWEKKEIERLTEENKMLLQEDKQIEQMVQGHLKEIAKEHAEMMAREKKEIERLTEENKMLEHRVAEESHWCKHANADHHICDICGEVPPWREVDKERGICMTCAEHMDDGLKYYTEEFAHASAHGKDALSLLVLRQRADNCRDLIAAAAGSYDGYLEEHEASVEEKMLNKRAAKCLARLSASFAPWWKDTWTHEKWCEMGQARDAAGWPVEKGAPIVQRLAAMFVAEEEKVYDLKKKQSEEKKEAWEEGAKKASQSTEALMKLQLKELEAKHAEVLANIERARTEDMEAVEARHQREMGATCEELEAARKELAEQKALVQVRERSEQDWKFEAWDQREIAEGSCQETVWEKKEIERLTEENKKLEHRVAEESHWCKHANLTARTAEMHAQMLRTDVAQLQKENEDLRKLVFPSLNLEAASSGVKLEPELAPKFPQVVQASPQLVAALKAEKTWNQGVDVCYVLTKKDYEAIVKAQGPLPPVEVVEDDVDLELLQKMVSAAPLPPSPPSSPPLAPDYPTVCGAAGCCGGIIIAEPEPKPKPNYNHANWPSPKTKRFAKHLAKHSGQTDPKTIKTHEDALEYIAKRAKISIETLLGYSIKQYQTAHEPWSLPGEPWAPENPEAFII